MSRSAISDYLDDLVADGFITPDQLKEGDESEIFIGD